MMTSAPLAPVIVSSPPVPNRVAMYLPHDGRVSCASANRAAAVRDE
jgi:hypothetical protein